ncbi:glutathione S-transferase [Cyathus striatus]|nr:glutathione S-transferase [Cyathus striatus]
MPNPNIIVHYLEDSRAQRIVWLLEELDLPYTLKEYNRTPDGKSPPELFEIHPLGKSPVIADGEIVLAESGAIIEYIIQKHGKGKVSVPESGWLDNLYFCNYVEGSFQELLVRRRVFESIASNYPAADQPLAKRIAEDLDAKLVVAELERHAKFIEAHLEKTKGSWVAGGSHPTSADYLLFFSLEILINRAPEFVGTRVREYVTNVQTRQAYKRAVEKLSHYAYIVPN